MSSYDGEGRAPKRLIAIPDPLWSAAAEVAAAEGVSRAELVRVGLEREVARRKSMDPTAPFSFAGVRKELGRLAREGLTAMKDDTPKKRPPEKRKPRARKNRPRELVPERTR